MGQVLNVSNLRVELDGVTILEDLSFELSDNETLVILGPNGAGKTVLLRTLLGLIPYTGEIAWKTGVRIGYVPQRVSLTKDLPVTVADFFRLKNIDRKRAAEVLQEVGIYDAAFLSTQLGILSPGQFQRVLIAWALVNNPNVLLFDEPTAGIDIGGEDTVHSFLHRKQAERNVSVILVTHDLSTVYSEATRVLCIHHKKYCYGPPVDVLDPKVLQDIYGKDIKFVRHSHD
jgi:zinc transport system ATP-binding protein